MSKRNCCAAVLLLYILMLAGIFFLFWKGERRNHRLLSGDEDAVLAADLKSQALPAVEAISRYHTDSGEYPETLDQLIPEYLQNTPGEFLEGRVVYNRRPYYGVPFYFAFRGNYSGAVFLHGWAIIYCPLSACEIDGPPSRRIDDTWLFYHSSAF